MQGYSSQFYDEIAPGSRRSANVVAPLILAWTGARSIVDVGCGTGTWLSVFRSLGVPLCVGLDGSYVDRLRLEIASTDFFSVDLDKPFTINREFDLAISLEVAEHIERASANSFIASLTELAPAVCFSAAIPFQGGNNHVNEQWPDYWAERFERHGFLAIDALRPQVWNNAGVEFWYAQNIIMFAKPHYLAAHPELQLAFERTNHRMLSMVHPRMWKCEIDESEERAKRRALQSATVAIR